MSQSGQLNEYTERKEMSADVVCMSLANVPPGEQRSRFLAVGLVDNTVRIISLDPSVSSCAACCCFCWLEMFQRELLRWAVSIQAPFPHSFEGSMALDPNQ